MYTVCNFICADSPLIFSFMIQFYWINNLPILWRRYHLSFKKKLYLWNIINILCLSPFVFAVYVDSTCFQTHLCSVVMILLHIAVMHTDDSQHTLCKINFWNKTCKDKIIVTFVAVSHKKRSCACWHIGHHVCYHVQALL